MAAMQTHTRLICGTMVSLRRLVADGRAWLNARDFAAAIGYSAGHATKLVREQSPEQCRQLRDLVPGSSANDLYLSTEAVRLLAGRVRQPREFADQLTAWFEDEVMPPSAEPPEPPEPPPAQPEPQPAARAAQPPDEMHSRMQRLLFLKTCKDAADAWELPIDARMRKEVQTLLADALLPDGEHDSEYVDAAQLLRERGHTEAQICRLAGELGKDLKLATGGSTHQAAARFGADSDKNIQRYHREKDARAIETVLASFMQRDLYREVAGGVRLDPNITQLLEERGRGRKRPAPSAIRF
jgi:prophage antirepressor-like protein